MNTKRDSAAPALRRAVMARLRNTGGFFSGFRVFSGPEKAAVSGVESATKSFSPLQ
jgi:hypothetical protein